MKCPLQLAVLWIRIGFNVDPDPESLPMRIPILVGLKSQSFCIKIYLQLVGLKHTYGGTKALMKVRKPGLLVITDPHSKIWILEGQTINYFSRGPGCARKISLHDERCRRWSYEIDWALFDNFTV
jgi:hypothetical protein